jgi:phosphoribosylformylglycinamidine synthase I
LRIAVLRFPGSNCELDTLYVLRRVLGVDADLVWHEAFDRSGYDAVILPGGFSYGDYLRAGTIAAHSPAMGEVRSMADEGKPVIGICNGFQILTEAGLLPGALLRNEGLNFVCRWVSLRVESNKSALTWLLPKGAIIRLPIAHAEGRYVNERRAIKELWRNGQVILTYVDESGKPTPGANPNGSMDNIAGICNEWGNVVGLMPHPERGSERILSPFGSEDGLMLFESMISFKDGRDGRCGSI